MQNKIKNLLNELNKGLIERDQVIKTCLLTLMTGENMVIIGPPGTAKSEVARRISDIFSGDKYFEYLLTKFTTPEEIFGPISLKELENDIFKRNTQGYLPTSKIGFLDEIFKANSSILNSLLTILNEGIYHNGSIKERANTRSIIGASNELPTKDSELYALYDRFLTKIQIDYVKDPSLLFFNNTTYKGIDEKLKFSSMEFENILKKSKDIIFSPEVLSIILKIKNKIELLPTDSLFPENISDRKLMKFGKLLKTAAYTSGKDKVEVIDLILLKHTLWNNFENFSSIVNILEEEILGIDPERINLSTKIYKRWEEVFDEKFKIQEKNNQNKLLYYDINNNKVTISNGEIHLRDFQGEFLFFKGHREYVTASFSQSQWNLGFIDTGYKLMDDKKIWYYESSSTKVTSSPERILEGWDPLSINGNLPPVVIDDFDEFLEKKDTVKVDNLIDFKNIKSNLEEELTSLGSYLQNLKEKKAALLETQENIWISHSEKTELLKKLENFRNITKNLEEKYSILFNKIIILLGDNL